MDATVSVSRTALSGTIRLLTLVLLACFVLGLSGCSLAGSRGGSEPVASAKGGKRGTKPYTINGKTYYPLTTADGFREEGIASWYGRDFHGKSTANGERYDMYSMTAAHKLLPFNTDVRVTNKTNGKSIIVRVNDRGPFITNRVIDLTRTGAEKLGMLGPGTAKVVVEVIGSRTASAPAPDPAPKPAPVPRSGQKPAAPSNPNPTPQNRDLAEKYYVQVGAFSSRESAGGLASRLQSKGLQARSVHAPDRGLWRVQAGPYASLRHAEEASTSMSREFPRNVVVAE